MKLQTKIKIKPPKDKEEDSFIRHKQSINNDKSHTKLSDLSSNDIDKEISKLKQQRAKQNKRRTLEQSFSGFNDNQNKQKKRDLRSSPAKLDVINEGIKNMKNLIKSVDSVPIKSKRKINSSSFERDRSKVDSSSIQLKQNSKLVRNHSQRSKQILQKLQLENSTDEINPKNDYSMQSSSNNNHNHKLAKENENSQKSLNFNKNTTSLTNLDYKEEDELEYSHEESQTQDRISEKLNEEKLKLLDKLSSNNNENVSKYKNLNPNPKFNYNKLSLNENSSIPIPNDNNIRSNSSKASNRNKMINSKFNLKLDDDVFEHHPHKSDPDQDKQKHVLKKEEIQHVNVNEIEVIDEVGIHDHDAQKLKNYSDINQVKSPDTQIKQEYREFKDQIQENARIQQNTRQNEELSRQSSLQDIKQSKTANFTPSIPNSINPKDREESRMSRTSYNSDQDHTHTGQNESYTVYKEITTTDGSKPPSRLDVSDAFIKNRPYLRLRYRRFNDVPQASMSDVSSIQNPSMSHIGSNSQIRQQDANIGVESHKKSKFDSITHIEENEEDDYTTINIAKELSTLDAIELKQKNTEGMDSSVLLDDSDEKGISAKKVPKELPNISFSGHQKITQEEDHEQEFMDRNDDLNSNGESARKNLLLDEYNNIHDKIDNNSVIDYAENQLGEDNDVEDEEKEYSRRVYTKQSINSSRNSIKDKYQKNSNRSKIDKVEKNVGNEMAEEIKVENEKEDDNQIIGKNINQSPKKIRTNSMNTDLVVKQEQILENQNIDYKNLISVDIDELKNNRPKQTRGCQTAVELNELVLGSIPNDSIRNDKDALDSLRKFDASSSGHLYTPTHQLSNVSTQAQTKQQQQKIFEFQVPAQEYDSLQDEFQEVKDKLSSCSRESRVLKEQVSFLSSENESLNERNNKLSSKLSRNSLNKSKEDISMQDRNDQYKRKLEFMINSVEGMKQGHIKPNDIQDFAEKLRKEI